MARLAALAEGKKRCPLCGCAKEPADFTVSTHSADGLDSYCKQCRHGQARARYYADRETTLLRKQSQTFSIPVERLRAMRQEQDNACAICHQPCPSGRALAVDHDHTTGAIRGLLCANCNRALGLLQDSPEVVASALAYLTMWSVTDAHVAAPMLDAGV